MRAGKTDPSDDAFSLNRGPQTTIREVGIALPNVVLCRGVMLGRALRNATL